MSFSTQFRADKTMLWQSLNVPIYGNCMWLMVFPSPDKVCYPAVVKRLGAKQAKALGLSDADPAPGAHGLVHYSEIDGTFLILLAGYDNPKGPQFSAGTIAHEAGHAARFVLSRAGVDLDFENDEPEAYLTGWLVNVIHALLEKHKLRITSCQNYE